MKKIIIKLLTVSVALGVLGGVVLTGTLLYFSFGLPKISTLSDYKPNIPSRILSKDGTVLAEIGREKRNITKFEDIPRRVVDAFLSAEDDSFYEHTGVDYMGVLRAMLANLRAGRVVQGGSTITQQVAKSLLLTRERSISRKIKDFLLAQKIEEKFSKEEILFLYLNQVYLGGGYYGIKVAFDGYYDKTLEEATIAEAAMIAGLLVAPSKYSPYRNPKQAIKRQRYVLKRMFETQKISEEEYKSAREEKIKFRLRKSSLFKAGYFTDWVRQRVISKIGDEEFLTGGYTVKTTLDYDLQKVAEREILRGVGAIDKRQGYKGAIEHIEDAEEIRKLEAEFRKKKYSEDSTYFTIDENKEKEYEMSLAENEMELLDNYRDQFLLEGLGSKFHPGYNPEDKLLPQIKQGELYHAFVTKTDDRAKLIYVSIGGVSGVIDYDGFKWAHERHIAVERKFFPYVRRPSSILKKGDKILVKVKKKKVNFFRVANKEYLKTLAKMPKDKSKIIRRQSFLHCLLDQKADVEAALVSLDPFSGEIVSFVGGKNFKLSQFNRAIQSKRQPGSAFKPLLYAASLENGFTPASILIDSPETLGGVDETLNWKPRNYDGKFKGPMTLRNSLEVSRNVTTIKLASELGINKITSFMDRIGFNAKLDPDLSLALGSFGVTLLDIARTYAVFPNGGKRVEAKSILSVVDRFGSVVDFSEIETVKKKLGEEKVEEVASLDEEGIGLRPTPQLETESPFLASLDDIQVYDRRLAYLMTNILRGVVLHGTGRNAREVSSFIGGKTGTTNNFVDAWFLGFSSNLVTGVWAGFDENETLGWGETGGKSALPIWKEFMRYGLRKLGEFDFRQPSGIINVLIDKQTGRPLTGASEGGFMEAFVEGTQPGSSDTEVLGTNNTGESNDIFEEDDYYTNQ
jgi:penicillin-binding protein 1A